MNSISFMPFSSNTFQLIKKSQIFTTSVRNYAAPRFWKRDAVKCGCVTYYPKHRDHKDPPVTPSKLFMVTLAKRFAGNPYWDKNTLKILGLAERGRDPVIVKNTPEMCGLLWKVKHLVKITPIKLPDKLPDPDDLGGSYLHENGTFYVTPKVDPLRIESTEEFENNPKKLDSLRIGEKLRLQWLNSGMY